MAPARGEQAGSRRPVPVGSRFRTLRMSVCERVLVLCLCVCANSGGQVLITPTAESFPISFCAFKDTSVGVAEAAARAREKKPTPSDQARFPRSLGRQGYEMPVAFSFSRRFWIGFPRKVNENAPKKKLALVAIAQMLQHLALLFASSDSTALIF